jgi:Ca2+-binding RTX toxin-like protein
MLYSNVRIVGSTSSVLGQGDNLDFTNVQLIGIAAIDGGAGNDTIIGSSAADTIIGGAGNDSLSGGGGNDRFEVIGVSGTDFYDGGSGFDTIYARKSLTPTATTITFAGLTGIERIEGEVAGLRLLGTTVDDHLDFSAVELINVASIDGGSGADTIIGSGAADLIIGGAGNDSLVGGGGSDTFEIRASAGLDRIVGGDDEGTSDRIVIIGTNVSLAWNMVTPNSNPATSLNLISGIEVIDGIAATGTTGGRLVGSTVGDVMDMTGITLIGIKAIDGGSGNDTITGSSGNDTIVGGAGNDVLNGANGDDVFLIASSAGIDVINGGAGYDRIQASASSVAISFSRSWSGIEEIAAGSTNNVAHTNVRIVGGTAGDEMDFSLGDGIKLTGIAAIDGGAGNDTITGSSGNDTIVGGSGNDSLNGGLGDDVFQIAASAGTDTINGGDAAGYDVIKVAASNVSITFGSWSNIDEVSAGVGDGAFTGTRIVGTAGNNVIDFSAANLANPGIKLTGIAAIDGLAGNDVIRGTNGADTIVGGSGADTLTGGGGADVFDYNLVAESRGGTLDQILDFTDGVDLIDFRDIDGNSLQAGDQALKFIGEDAFSGGLGELRYEKVGNITRLLIDLDGNKVADMEIQLKDFGGTLTDLDFLL